MKKMIVNAVINERLWSRVSQCNEYIILPQALVMIQKESSARIKVLPLRNITLHFHWASM